MQRFDQKEKRYVKMRLAHVPRVGAAALVIAGTAAAGGTASATRAGRGAGIDLSYVTAQVARYRAIPSFTAPGPGFNAAKAAAGKTLFVIPSSSAIPFVQTIATNMQTIAKKIGLGYVIWPNQGQPSEWAQGMSAAVNRKASSVDLLAGINPAALQPQIITAKSAGVSTVVSHLYNVGQTPAANLAATVDIPYEQAGRLLADYTILKAGASADALVITIDEVVSTQAMVRGIKGEFANHCTAACKLSFINVSIPEVATRIQPQVQTALIRDPKINYVIALYDSAEAPFAVAGITAAGATGRVKVVTFNGTPSILKMVRDGGVVQMDIGENLNWIARAILDQHLRLMGGLAPVANPRIPLRIFDQSNIGDTGNPPQDSKGFGSGYVAGYDKLWSGK